MLNDLYEYWEIQIQISKLLGIQSMFQNLNFKSPLSHVNDVNGV